MPKNRDYDSPVCTECNKRKVTRTGWYKDGRPKFKNKCDRCLGRPIILSRQQKYIHAVERKRETMKCEKCGFKAEHPCQLDVDHIDGNRNNNDPTNHQILCANCHRLKTQLNGENSNTYS